MKVQHYILSLVSCFLLASCFTVIETTTNGNEYYIDNSEHTTIIINNDVHLGGGFYPRPIGSPVIKEPVTKNKERKSERSSNGTKLRDTGRQRASNTNGNVNRGDNRDSKNVKKSSESQRR